MTLAFSPPADAARVFQTPRFATYELAWLDEDGRPQWDSRRLAATKGLDSACAGVARGALLETSQGFVAVEDLMPGDAVRVKDGSFNTVHWIGARTYFSDDISDPRPTLYRVEASSFGDRVPMAATILAEPASLYVESKACQRIIGTPGAFAPVAAFDDGVAISKVTPLGDVTLYNLAFEAQDAFMVNGLAIESFHMGRNNMHLVNTEMLRDMTALLPHITPGAGFTPQTTPRLSVTEARMLSDY